MRDWKSYERSVAKALGQWWGCVFRRTPSSGAWGKQGQSRFAKKSQDAAGDFHGDIVAPPEARFPFSVECKCYKEVEIYKAMYGKSNVYSWWRQCQNDTPKGMYPMLIMKENMKKPLLVLGERAHSKLRPYIPSHLPYLRLHRGSSKLKPIYIYDMALFTEFVDAARVMEVL